VGSTERGYKNCHWRTLVAVSYSFPQTWHCQSSQCPKWLVPYLRKVFGKETANYKMMVKDMWRPRHISFRYAVNGPTKPQEALTNREAEYFRLSQASLFWPIRTAATAYKTALAGNFGYQLVTNHRGVNIAGTPPQRNRAPCSRHYRALTARNASGLLARNTRYPTGPFIQRFTQATPLSTSDALGYSQRSTGFAAAIALHWPLQRLTG
jgi:hypothetical protein